MIRILAGRYKGKKLSAGSDFSIRPVTNKIKESVFNSLGDFVECRKVLDLFSGSGSFGLEALSRGAGHITFVEKSKKSCRILKKNLESLSGTATATLLICSDIYDFIRRCSDRYNLILMDPPFNFSGLQALLDEIMDSNLLAPEGLLVLHHEKSNPVSPGNEQYRLLKQKNFGRNMISILCHEVSHA